ncbi:conjugal transfer protein TraW, partial [Klebsiella pneumoniae]|uniref:conjugal transfer protein TraW n=1 Tax=Klebsiella pneumoniae TaxID=573 RepID=UPI003B5A61A0
REFESFEVGRRYANTDYQEDLQAMDGDNLMRELIRVQSLSNYLQLGIKNQLRESNIIAGQQLALAAAREYRPQLQA